jgi:porphobilinogen deaminase
LGAYATLAGGRLSLKGFICEPDGSHYFEGVQEGAMDEAEAVGSALAAEAAKCRGA